LDSYETRLLADVSFGGAWSGLDDELRSSKAIQGILPVRIDMESIPQGWSLKRSDLDGYTLKLGDYGRTRLAREVTFTLTRGSANKLFIFTLLSCPLLILAAFAWKGLQQVREGMNGLSPLELASTLLALLAMRQVLVPTDIPGFTIADKILGIELTVTVAVAVVLYVWPTRVAAAPVVVEAESPRLVVVQSLGAADKNTHWHSKGAISRGDERAGRRVQ
jgi:F0F1-type ATP synthase assembly protein I